MNKRFIGVLIFAFVVASGASLLLYRVLVNRPGPIGAPPAMAQVVLAKHDIDPGSVLRDEDLKLADWPGSPPLGSSVHLDRKSVV